LRCELRILITFALDLEFAPWRWLHRFAKIANCRYAAYEGRFGEAQVRAVLTGVGGARAKSVVNAAFEWQPDICIAAGLAGSLRPDYHVGQILVARDIIELESGRTVVTDDDLINRAEAGKAVVIGRLLTSATMVLSAEGKRRLGSMAAAVEMESFAVAAEAAAAGIPAIAIRAISDDVDEDLPMNFGDLLDESGAVNKARIARAVARAPHKLPALMRLGRQSKAASVKLAEFLERYVTGLAAGSSNTAEMAEARRA
jgi:adenosylhomocysteine nucleosidase